MVRQHFTTRPVGIDRQKAGTRDKKSTIRSPGLAGRDCLTVWTVGSGKFVGESES